MELRKDYILDRWVVIAPKRGKRPHDFCQPAERPATDSCHFCPGSEAATGVEIGRVEEDGHWIIRCFPNIFPFLEPGAPAQSRTDNTFYTFAPAIGEQEVIVETTQHGRQLHELPVAHIKKLLNVYQTRIHILSARNEYVLVFKNHGRDAGTSLFHSHSQVAATSIIPPLVQAEVDASTRNGCSYCDIINREKDSHRRAIENNHFVAFCPYASRFNFEVWIFPKRHIPCITKMDDEMLESCAEILKALLVRLSTLNADYNFYLHYAPKGTDLHFHIEVIPRLAVFAGFEYGSGVYVNQVSPEDAAKFYRGEQ